MLAEPSWPFQAAADRAVDRTTSGTDRLSTLTLETARIPETKPRGLIPDRPDLIPAES
jgi:hypothetical protein